MANGKRGREASPLTPYIQLFNQSCQKLSKVASLPPELRVYIPEKEMTEALQGIKAAANGVMGLFGKKTPEAKTA